MVFVATAVHIPYHTTWEHETVTTATAPEAEDLTAVKGIGPKFAERLHAAGIQTVAQLLSTPASNLANTLAVSESRATAILEAAQTDM